MSNNISGNAEDNADKINRARLLAEEGAKKAE